jgi:glycine oxidase
MESKDHYLIVGAGLSGIAVGLHLLDFICKVTLIDKGENKSSVVAAGQINPLVFRRMTKSWRVDEFLPFAQAFYKQIEKQTNTTFYNQIPIRRFFSSLQEKELWLSKQTQEEFSSYMTQYDPNENEISGLKNEYGSALVKQTAFIDTNIFLKAAIKTIKYKGGVLNTEAFDYTNLNPETGLYKENTYTKIIFCEGADSVLNPWFSYLPIGATKGEILTVKETSITKNEAFNRKCFLLPIDEQTFKLGATYVWHTNNTVPTKEGKEELLKNASYLTDNKLEIIEHKAGVRPTTMDRRPILGLHHTYNKLAFFNGLGAKGYLLAPLIAKEYCEYLLHEKPFLKEMHIDRYKKLIP